MTESEPRDENGTSDGNTETHDPVATLIEKICTTDFDTWYRERQFVQNIREGQPYFNGPSPCRDPRYHTPNKLNQCHRKIYYDRLNAPEEQPEPEGLFWFGTKFEEELAMEYLEDTVKPHRYVRNSIWLDFTIETETDNLRFRGETDPVVVDKDGVPYLPTEVKTTEVDNLTKPKKRHLAQVHAYLYGLSQEYDREFTAAVLLYTHRKTFSFTPFEVEFDSEFWRNTVVEWAETQTQYRQDEILPPADPELEWECEYCDYKHRCGEGNTNYENGGVRGFLPLFAEYPRDKVEEYLEVYSDVGAKLTPTLAHHYPDLANRFEVDDWQCEACETTQQWDSVDWNGNVDRPPLCPQCEKDGIPAPLSGPAPTESAFEREAFQ
ncbi:CRISPR-associated protein Cas4 [Halorussus salinus]|uniref:CRISPR-associated protein Cas4 n=1 Tax=Halorussus salinus TaxID=1364935 RepID=UPI001091BEB3|nr:PD-(D/E)XK nuclease family protein [Halorussus salinus]